ncbi:VWA domain-containing protein [Pseudohongiella sp. SYSU M77423]|uniref:VWA domain-containing protein n=1 Tax=Pseudohongiella sp. SYSU M77423 TaxID=3042312 RepID=UPI002480DB4D|nr:VWA domain-containing protein [Pseudohongiella sp. SYSU M77423]MDH7945021.1 VWA domain-containing protein [Pseudohongiella sp. SYSU M77423]
MNESVTLAQAIADFHFLRPLWLLALIPALFFFRRLWKLDAQGSAWHKVIDQSLLPYLLNASKNTSQRLPLYLLLAVWVLGIVALSGPTWSKQTQPVQQRQDALVIVLDLSLGMFANDFEPNRITVARRKIMDILDIRREGQTALLVYAGEAHLVTPLTDDSVSIRAMVPALNPNIMPVIGNNPAMAVSMANDLMREAGTTNGRILLITSGVPADEVGALRDAGTGGYPVHIIGVGTRQGAPIPAAGGEFLRDSNGQVVISAMDRGALQDVAATLGGRYHDITVDGNDLETVLAESLRRGENDTFLETEEEVELWRDAGPWLLLLMLPLCALCFRRGWVLQVALTAGLLATLAQPTPVMAQQDEQEPDSTDPLTQVQTQTQSQTQLPTPDEVQGLTQEMGIGGAPQDMQMPVGPPEFDWRAIYLNSDQRAARALEEDNPAVAAMLFENEAWRAAANYKAGNYQAAIEGFSQSDDVRSLYNLGNALAHAERFEESIAAYDRVLAQEPDHADALHNKEIVEQLLQQQQEQQEQEQQEQEQQEQSEAEAESEENEEEAEPALEDEQEPQEQEPQEPQEQETPPQETEDAQTDDSQKNQRSENTEFEEDQESLEQFLRRIEDNPGELLQRKFQFESRRRMLERRQASQ